MSTKILYDQQCAYNEFLALINACVSHELRNPLNAIVAQNSLKMKLYEKLQWLVDSCRKDTVDNKISFKTIVNLLEPIMD